MVGKKFNNENQHVKTIEDNFSSIFNALRNFKKLSEQEAIIYIEIMKKKKVTIAELAQILRDKDIKTTTTKPYAIIKNLINADLLFCKEKHSRNKTFQPIHPRDLIIDIKESMNKLDNELALIESEEVNVFQEISESSEKFDSEYEITDSISKLTEKKYEIEFYFNQMLLDKEHSLHRRLVKHFSLKPKHGKFSVIFGTKKDDKIFPYVAILLLKNYKVDQKNDIIGAKVVDPEIVQCLKKGVE